MATRYKKYADKVDYNINAIQRILNDGSISCIPVDEENTDYIEYLEWVAKGNTAEAAD